MQRGDQAAARAALSDLAHPKALHLLALVEKSAGDFDSARELLERAAVADPGDPEIANNQAVLAVQTGDRAAGEAAFKRALALRPDFLQAATGLGRLLIDEARWQEAETVYAKLKADSGDSVPVRYGYATVQLGLGHVEAAEATFDELVRSGNSEPQIRFMRARARLEQKRIEEALEDLEAAHATGPSEHTLKTLAGTLWMTGDRQRFDKLLGEAVRDPALVVTGSELMRQSGDPVRAIRSLDKLRESHVLPPEAWIVSASACIDANDPVAAEKAARTCLEQDPSNRIIPANLTTSLLMQGKADEALDVALTMRAREPLAQHWIAYQATALRLLDDPDYGRLVDLDRFVRPYALPVPDGYDSIEDFNAAFLSALDRWHPYERHPLDQSLRDGSQT
ncbi:MAG: tetratricopeptide repeat protein, partial [Pseudomonadota bacterium]